MSREEELDSFDSAVSTADVSTSSHSECFAVEEEKYMHYCICRLRLFVDPKIYTAQTKKKKKLTGFK